MIMVQTPLQVIDSTQQQTDFDLGLHVDLVIDGRGQAILRGLSILTDEEEDREKDGF